MWYNINTEAHVGETVIGKSLYGQINIVAHQTAIGKMERAGWFNPPLSPQEIPKISQVFKNKKHYRAKMLYSLLLARSYELGGITKISEVKVAELLQITTRQARNLTKFLIKNKLIVTLNQKLWSGNVVKTSRIFMVWLSLFTKQCKTAGPRQAGLRCDPRVYCEEWKNAIYQIPRKYKIGKPEYGINRIIVIPVMYDWDMALADGLIDLEMYTQISKLTQADESGYGRQVIGLMGRTKKQRIRNMMIAKGKPLTVSTGTTSA